MSLVAIELGVVVGYAMEYAGYIAPGVAAILLPGFFYRRANMAGAFAVLTSSVAANLVLKFGLPDVPYSRRAPASMLLRLS